MIQSPRGSIDFISHNRFDREILDQSDISTPNSTSNNTLQHNTSHKQKQLLSNDTRNRTLSPQIMRQLAYSNTLHDNYYYHYYY